MDDQGFCGGAIAYLVARDPKDLPAVYYRDPTLLDCHPYEGSASISS